MTINTPAEVASAVVPFDGSRPTDRAPFTWDEVANIAEAAIKADRAQHDAAKRYVVMVRGTGKNRGIADAEMGRFESRYNANAVAAAWNGGNGKNGFEYWVEDEGQGVDPAEPIEPADVVQAAAERWLAHLEGHTLEHAFEDEKPEIQKHIDSLRDALAELDGEGATP